MTEAVEPISIDGARLTGPTVAAQQWQEATFLHWRVAPAAVAPLLPPGIRPDCFDGSSWVGLIAFRLRGARLGPLPPVPYVGTFTEVNVRLYGIDPRGRRGVVFRSLEASRLIAVITARVLFSVPYRWARTAQDGGDGMINYRSRRHRTGEQFELAVRPDLDRIADDDLSAFLTARWALFTARRGHTLRLPNTHEPWALHPAAVTGLRDDLVAAAGLPGITAREPDSVLYSPGVSARFGPPRRVDPVPDR